MTKFNYNEPEFKVVKALSEDVITTSLDPVNDAWNTGTGNNPGTIGANNLFTI